MQVLIAAGFCCAGLHESHAGWCVCHTGAHTIVDDSAPLALVGCLWGAALHHLRSLVSRAAVPDSQGILELAGPGLGDYLYEVR